MTLYLLNLEGLDIFQQLQIEEALLRNDSRNFCLLNHNTTRAIVMGISGKEQELVYVDKVKEATIPVIRRFSGGGTVITDPSTVFSSFIFNHTLLNIAPFPESILKWTFNFYNLAFNIEQFCLKEHDFAINNLKCAGNAQYLRKERFVHHTTFLWDFSEENMSYLLQPKKMPTYRENRSHKDFLCSLKPFIDSAELVKEKIISQLCMSFEVKQLRLEDVEEAIKIPHRKTTAYVSLS